MRLNGRVIHDAQCPVVQGVDRIEIDGRSPAPVNRLVVMLNKPRGLVTTTKDEQGRDTVYSCFSGADLPWLAPVGRLDKASEGLLLFTNDPVWAARITDSKAGLTKTYHVQIDTVADAALLAALERGVTIGDERLAVVSARCLRSGERRTWLEITLDEGRNRHIRRLLATLNVTVVRLVRVAVGRLKLAELRKGQWRVLSVEEIDSLAEETRP